MMDVKQALAPPPDWTDNPQQAQIRACLTHVLDGHDPVTAISVCTEMIAFLRDQMLTAVAQVRREAAHTARQNMSVTELATAAKQSRPTISRLIAEYKEQNLP